MPARASAGDVETGRRKAEACAACHGRDGNSTIPAVPSLAGQPVFYTHWQLILFRDQRRKDPQMSPVAASLSDADMADLAAYYAAQRPVSAPAGRRDPEKVAAGQRLAQLHHCASCHAPTFTGQQYAPRLRGLSYEYLLRQLRGFKTETRGELDGSMTTAAQPLTEPEIEALAHYLAHLP
jgi:cytochrome c553